MFFVHYLTCLKYLRMFYWPHVELVSLCRLGSVMNHCGWKLRFAPEIVVEPLNIEFQENIFSA